MNTDSVYGVTYNTIVSITYKSVYASYNPLSLTHFFLSPFLSLALSLALFHVFTFYISVSISAHTQTYITYNLLLHDGMVACSHSDSSFCSNDDFESPRATSSIVVWNQTISWELRFHFFKFIYLFIYYYFFFVTLYVNINFKTDREEKCTERWNVCKITTRFLTLRFEWLISKYFETTLDIPTIYEFLIKTIRETNNVWYQKFNKINSLKSRICNIENL